MKTIRLILALCCILPLVSCGDDWGAPDSNPSDLSGHVAGVYTGQLKYGTEVVEDAYVVTITRLSSSVVSMDAKFLDTEYNFNVTKEGNVYTLSSATVYNITTTVSDKQMTLNYLTKGGYMYTFLGTRD